MFKYILTHPFVKNVFSLMSGNVLAQVIGFGVSPIVTRLFTPENLGTLALFTSFSLILSQIASLCYERAILLPKEEDDAINILFLALAILLITSLLIMILCLFLSESIAKLLNNSEMSFWILFLPMSVFFSGGYKIYRLWFLRQERFRDISKSRVLHASATGIFRIVPGILMGAFSGWLIGSFIAGFFLSFFYLICLSTHLKFRSLIDRFSVARIKTLAIKYKQFPLFASWNALLNASSQYLTVFMFSIFFSPAIVGFYSLGNRVLRQPIITLSTSVQNAYFQKSSRQRANNAGIISGFQKTIIILFLIGIGPFSVLFFWSEELFSIIFGNNWATAGLYVQIMAPSFFSMAVSVPSNVIYEVLQKQKVKLSLSISRVILTFVGLFLGGAFFENPKIAIGIFVWANVFMDVINNIIAYRMIKRFS